MTPRGEQQLITELQVISQYLMRIANSLEKKAGEDPIASFQTEKCHAPGCSLDFYHSGPHNEALKGLPE